jgi:hypothetical protein
MRELYQSIGVAAQLSPLIDQIKMRKHRRIRSSMPASVALRARRDIGQALGGSTNETVYVPPIQNDGPVFCFGELPVVGVTFPPNGGHRDMG